MRFEIDVMDIFVTMIVTTLLSIAASIAFTQHRGRDSGSRRTILLKDRPCHEPNQAAVSAGA